MLTLCVGVKAGLMFGWGEVRVFPAGGDNCCCSGTEARFDSGGPQRVFTAVGSCHPIPPAGAPSLIPPGLRHTVLSDPRPRLLLLPPTPTFPLVCVCMSGSIFGPGVSGLLELRLLLAVTLLRAEPASLSLSSSPRCWDETGVSGCRRVCLSGYVCGCVCMRLCVGVRPLPRGLRFLPVGAPCACQLVELGGVLGLDPFQDVPDEVAPSPHLLDPLQLELVDGVEAAAGTGVSAAVPPISRLASRSLPKVT